MTGTRVVWRLELLERGAVVCGDVDRGCELVDGANPLERAWELVADCAEDGVAAWALLPANPRAPRNPARAAKPATLTEASASFVRP